MIPTPTPDERGDLARRWTQVLDDYELRLDEQRSAVAQASDGTDLGGRGVPPAFVAPAGLGPMPAALAPRANALAEATRDLAASAARVLAGLPVPSAAPRAVPTAGVASRFDRAL